MRVVLDIRAFYGAVKYVKLYASESRILLPCRMECRNRSAYTTLILYIKVSRQFKSAANTISSKYIKLREK